MADENPEEKAARLAAEINDLVDTIISSSEELSAFESAVPNLDATTPVRGADQWQDVRKKVVPLDAAIMALHLIAARIAFHGYAQIIANEIKNVVEFVSKIALRGISIWSVIASVLNKVLSLYDLIVSAIDDGKMVEKVRDSGYYNRRELAQSNLLLRGHDQRVKKVVSTRH